MALPLAKISLTILLMSPTIVLAQQVAVAPIDQQIASLAKSPPAYSRECRITAPAHEGRTALRAMRRALKEGRVVRVLAIGSSSTSGVGASSPFATYPVRLENDLEVQFKGVDIDVISRGVPGEAGMGACSRMKREVAEAKPDLVVWQIGTNDAVGRADIDELKVNLARTLQWLARNHIDVVLIDPQFTSRLAADDHYTHVVRAIEEVAKQERVLLVHRFSAMADLAKQKGEGALLAGDRFHLNDLGYRCMAEYAAGAIVAGLIQAQLDAAVPAPQK
jgi:lysophospholipase L1-like esterase